MAWYRRNVSYRDVRCKHKFIRVRTRWEKWAQPVLLFACRNCTTMVQKHLYLVETPAGQSVKIKKVCVRHGDFKPIPEEELRSEAIANIQQTRSQPNPILGEAVAAAAPAISRASATVDATQAGFPTGAPPSEFPA